MSFVFLFNLDFRIWLQKLRICLISFAGQEGIAKQESHLRNLEFDGENMSWNGNVPLFSRKEAMAQRLYARQRMQRH
jgi:hypothetical protein